MGGWGGRGGEGIVSSCPDFTIKTAIKEIGTDKMLWSEQTSQGQVPCIFLPLITRIVSRDEYFLRFLIINWYFLYMS